MNRSVEDQNGEPLIGVTVAELNTTNGAITDIDGNFLLLNVLRVRLLSSVTLVIRM